MKQHCHTIFLSAVVLCAVVLIPTAAVAQWGHVSVDQGVNVTPTPVVLNRDFTVSFTLREVSGDYRTFESIAVTIFDPGGTQLFDLALYNNVTIGAYSTWSRSPTGQIYGNPPGTYQAVIRGKLPGGGWFDFDTTNPSVANPRSFTVVEATINVTSPNGGEVWDIGSSHAITWTSQYVTGNVLIQPYRNGSPETPITTSTTNDGYYLWTIPSSYAPSNQYKIGMSAHSGTVSDFSANYFTIRPQAPTMTSPNGGESWAIGSVQRIEWTNPGGYTSFTTSVSYNGGSTWSTIESGLPGDYTFRDWTVSGYASTNCRIRVTGDYSGGSRYDDSNSSFTICEPGLDVVYPNGGQSLWMGHDYTVTWSSSCLSENVKIELYRGASAMVLQFEAGTPNDGQQVINLPVDGTLPEASDYRIAIAGVSGSAWDFSDSYFTILKPTITVTSPISGATYSAGQVVPIRWTTNQVLGDIHVEVYQDQTPFRLLNGSAPNTGSYDWTVPADVPSDACYRIGLSAMWGHVYSFSQCFVIATVDPMVSSTSGAPGETLQQPGWGFTPGGSAELHFRRPDGSLSPTATEAVAGDGTYNHSWVVTMDAQLGVYQYWAVDLATGLTSPEVSYTVYYDSMELTAPANGSIVSTVNAPFTWQNIGADFYELWVDDDSDFSSPVVSPKHFAPFKKDSLHVTTFPWGGGWFKSGLFYWKIKAYTGVDYVESPMWSFAYSPPIASGPVWAPIYRLYNATDKDHFYCTSENHRNIAQKQEYQQERIEGFLSREPYVGGTPVFRFYRPEDISSNTLRTHYYSADDTEIDVLIVAGWLYEGIVGYAQALPTPGLVPLHHLVAPSNVDHLYTTSDIEVVDAQSQLGFTYDGVVAYVSPSGDIPGIPAHMLGGVVGGINVASGNMRHYSKPSFEIASAGLPLTFEHMYNSTGVHLLSAVEPLGPGWSHTYNAYMLTVPGEYIVVWPDGSRNRYDQSTWLCLDRDLGVYDELTDVSPTQFKIKKKSKVVYTFRKPTNAPMGYPAMLASIADRNQNTITCQYETSGLFRLAEVVGTSGRRLSFTYSTTLGEEHLVASVEDVAGQRTVYFAYDDPYGNLTSYVDCLGRVSTYAYALGAELGGMDHELEAITLPNNKSIHNDYDLERRISGQQWVGDDENLSLSVDYGSGTVTDGKGNPTTFIFDPANGLMTSQLDGEGGNVTLEYNDPANKAMPTRATDKNGNVTTYQYDTRGNLTRVHLPTGQDQVIEYDLNDNITQVTDPRGGITAYSYDALGNLVGVTDPLGGTMSMTRNARGLVSSTTDRAGRTTLFDYDPYGNRTRETDALGNVLQFAYDDVSRLLSETDAAGKVTAYAWNNCDMLSSQTDKLNNPTVFAYDDLDNLTQVTDELSRTHIREYGADGLLKTVRNPAGEETRYSYNDDGTIASRMRATGTVTYSYDNSGRLSGIPSVGATFTRDANGNITSASNGWGVASFVYDAMNRLLLLTDANGQSVGTSYDAAGNLTQMVYPGNKTVTYTYDADNRMISVIDWLGNVTSYSYDAEGLLLGISYGNGVAANYSYDGSGRLTGLSHVFSGGVPLAQWSYERDAVGRIVSASIVEPFAAPELFSGSSTYQYTAANRLVSDGVVSYTFDGAGNMLTRTGSVPLTCSWNVENELVSISGVVNAQYVYDALGNRREAIRNGETTRYILDLATGTSRVVMETDASNSPRRYYVYGLGLIARIDPDDTAHYYHSDGAGSIVAMTDENQDVTHSYQYDTFGTVLEESEVDDNPFKFVGHYGVMEEAGGLYFMRARYYDPSQGRFLSEDMVWTTNLYSYAANDPCGFVDPTGAFPWLLPGFQRIGLGVNGFEEARAKMGFQMRRGARSVGRYFWTGRLLEHLETVTSLGLNLWVDFTKQNVMALTGKDHWFTKVSYALLDGAEIAAPSLVPARLSKLSKILVVTKSTIRSWEWMYLFYGDY